MGTVAIWDPFCQSGSLVEALSQKLLIESGGKSGGVNAVKSVVPEMPFWAKIKTVGNDLELSSESVSPGEKQKPDRVDIFNYIGSGYKAEVQN